MIGQSGYTSSSAPFPPTPKSLNHPAGIRLDPAGNLYVADFSNNRILQFKKPFANGMNASVAIGQTSLTSTDGGTTQNNFSGPEGIAFDGTGNLWVADFHNSRVLEFKPPFTTNMNASVVIGQPTFTSPVFATTRNGLRAPSDVAFDHAGNLYVVDNSNNRVLEFTPPFTNGMNASVVIGQVDFTSRTAATTQNNLNLPTGAGFDPFGNLFVGDYANDRVLEFKPPFTDNMKASMVIGQRDFTSTIADTTPVNLYQPSFVSAGAP